MSRNLGVSQTLEMLEGVRNASRDFSSHSAKLAEDFRVRTLRSSHRLNSTLEELARKLATDLSEEEKSFQTALERTKANYEKRKIRLGKAYRTSKERALAKVEEQTGNKKYALQRQMLQAERDREINLANAAKELEAFRTELASEKTSLDELERAVSRAFKGYRSFIRLLSASDQPEHDERKLNQQELLGQLRQEQDKIRNALQRFRHFFVLRFFKLFWVWVGLLLVVGGLLATLNQLGRLPLNYQLAGAGVAGGFVAILIVRIIFASKAGPVAKVIAYSLVQTRSLYLLSGQAAEAHYQQELQRIEDEFRTTSLNADQGLRQALSDATDLRTRSRTQTDEKTFRITDKHDKLHRLRLQRLESRHSETMLRLESDSQTSKQALTDSSAASEEKFKDQFQAQCQALETDWKTRTQSLFEKLRAAAILSDKLFPPWESQSPEQWKPPSKFEHAAKFGHVDVDLNLLSEAPPGSKPPPLDGSPQFSVPLCLTYPDEGSVIFETGSTGRDQAIHSLNNTILRLLSVAPPGRLNFTIIDPVGLGQNFAGVMHLADYEEQLIHSRIWTQSTQIEQRLADLNEHMEKVIQMYLRNEYATIAEYNEQAGVIAEKYQFLVIADFPVNFSDVAARRLLSIASSGARCGVYLLLHWDLRQPLPQDFVPDELRKSAIRLSNKGTQFFLGGRTQSGEELVLESPPPPEQAIQFIQTVGQSSRDSSRVEVPFSQVTPASDKIWTEDTTLELRVPIGRTGATKLQYLEIGKGTRQHGLVAGKTGSGKSTLFHVIITNLALWSSPEQVEFYLVDFKKGVEFKCYAVQRLPHAKVVAIESDREFGLSVLQKVDEELKRRGDLFRKLGVQDVAGYKRVGGAEPIPRSLLLIDEFQEFFVEDDKVSQTASLLLDRIVRQGRAFGIHVLLGSQTLGGAYTVARTTLGQMVIRIALQCNEADAYLIMDDNNPAPRLLSRPGEGIYNDTAGTLEGNSPFQVVWLPEHERDAALTKVRERADRNGSAYPGPFVFEGNAPADIRDNLLLQKLLEVQPLQPPEAPRIWMGAPNSIKGPTEAVFYRQSGNNLLMVGQREEAALAIFSIGLLALAAQYPIGSVRFIFCDASPPGSVHRAYLEHILSAIPHQVTLAKPGDLLEIMKGLVEEMTQRTESDQSAETPPVFLFIHALQRFSKLRFEEDFGFSSTAAEAAPNPSALFNTLITEGTRLGFHVLASCDTYNNVNRFLSRKALSEFEMRVLFQMSANDSASLIDNPKASTLGLHRALYYNEHEGYLETFRPYALPNREWIEQAGRKLEWPLKQAVEK